CDNIPPAHQRPTRPQPYPTSPVLEARAIWQAHRRRGLLVVSCQNVGAFLHFKERRFATFSKQAKFRATNCRLVTEPLARALDFENVRYQFGISLEQIRVIADPK